MRFLLPFTEDSSVIFAGRVAKELLSRGHEVRYLHIIDRNGEDAISARHLSQHIGDARFERIPMRQLEQSGLLDSFDAVCASRVPPSMRDMLASKRYRERSDRPCFVGFHAGLDMTPMRGFEIRRNFDVYFINKQADVEQYCKAFPAKHWQYVSWGHPYAVVAPEPPPSGLRNVYFFAQAISPKTRSSREHIVKVLSAIARANPDRTVFIKLRHLPGENARHVHKEEFDYPGLLAAMDRPKPDNLQLTDCSMSEALADAGAAITCTSTAAMDALAAGVPTAFYLDYVDHFFDPLRAPMYKDFGESGVITSLRDLLELRIAAPHQAWMRTRFRGPDLYDEMIEAIGRFRQDRTKSPKPSEALVPA